MKSLVSFSSLLASMAILVMTGCQKRVQDGWNDKGTATSFQEKLGQSIWGDQEQLTAYQENNVGIAEEDFIPLKDEDLKPQFADGAIPQPKRGPGEMGSGLPGIEHFNLPTSALAAVFRVVHFNTDDHILRGQESISLVERMATYLKTHASTYVFVEGHCDQRGPEAYNLALGTRRANFIRSLLVQKGVDPKQVHTISYGKEFPMDLRNLPEAWSKNRRVQFKVYEK